MSNVYVTSDWHIGHKGITERFRTQFGTDLCHDYQILKNARDTVVKRDILYVLGDVTWTGDGLRQIAEADFPCKMVMIGGNHDTLSIGDYLSVFDDYYGAVMYKGCFMTHIPIHRQELYRARNIHGHCHRGGPWEANKEPEYYNAILEYNDYKPVNIREIRKTFEDRGV